MKKANPFEHTVNFPLGSMRVILDRKGLALNDRGGFEAFWTEGELCESNISLSISEYREIIKEHLYSIYLEQEKAEPSKITLNLASHQLIDDLEGWTKLNFVRREV